jgi:uncharacterized repeat protein (TIGR02543 family)/LPXTG-motif cell wall-anchored protein
VTDELTGNTGDKAWTIDSLEPGETKTFTAEYVVEEKDVRAGSVKNVATAKGTGSDKEEPDVDPGEVEVPVNTPKPSLTVEKTAEQKEGGYALGDEIEYTIRVLNNGNVTVTDITVTDELTGMEETIASLAPGKEQSFTTKYKVAEKDILKGEVVNTARVSGTDPDEKPVDDEGEKTVKTEEKKTVTLTLVYDPAWKYIGGDKPDVTIEMEKGSTVDMSTYIIPGHEKDAPVSWYEEAGQNDTLITAPFIMNDDKTIYAGATISGSVGSTEQEGQKVTLTLVYDPLWKYIGGDKPDVTIEMEKGSTVDMTTLIIPGHEDDTSVSWYEEAGVEDTLITNPFTMDADKTIYAGTTINGDNGGKEPVADTTICLTYNSNGGTEIESRKFTETTIVDFEDANYIPTREGYTFTGWYTDETLQNCLKGKVEVSTDKTVFAGWEKKKAVETTTEDATETTTEAATEEKTKRTTTAKTKNSTKSTTSSETKPKTGDQNNLLLWVTLLFISSMGLAVTVVFGKKKNED